MKRRFFIRVLACLLVLALPFSAMAESAASNLLTKAQTEGKSIAATLTVTPSADLAKTQAIADLCAATKIQLVKSPADSMASMSMLLNDEAVLAAQLRLTEEGLFVQTDPLGSSAVFASWEDISQYLTSHMTVNGQNADALSSMMAQYQQAFTQGFQVGLNAAGSAVSSTSTELTTAELEKQLVDNFFGGDDSLIQWVNALYARAVVTEGAFPGEGVYDDATQKLELTLTQADFIAMLETSAMKTRLTKQGGMAEEDLTKLTDKLATMTISMPITVYKAENSIVCAEVDTTIDYVRTVTETVETSTTVEENAAADETTEPETVTKEVPVNYYMSMHLDRLTTDAGVTYSGKAALNQDQVEQIRMDGSITEASDKQTSAVMNVYTKGATDPAGIMSISYVPGENSSTAEMDIVATELSGSPAALVFTINENTADDAIDYAFGFSFANTLEAAKDEASATGATLNLHIALQDAAGSFDKVANATQDSSVQPFKMTSEERSTFISSVTTNALQTVFALIGKLPNSVLEAAGPLFNLQ